MSIRAMPYWKTVVMNWFMAAAFLVLGVVVVYMSRNDGALTVPVLIFLGIMFMLVPFTCLVTATALRQSAPTALASWSSGLNIAVAVFGALLIGLLYLSSRLSTGVVGAFIPFVINLISLSSYKADPTGRAI
jgi:hypothetical protein